MIIAEIITPWIGTGIEDDEKRSQLGNDFDLIRIKDMTKQPGANVPPNPNLYVTLATMTESVFADIEADPISEVLWSEIIPT